MEPAGHEPVYLVRLRAERRLEDDAALIGRARTGDVAAYEILVRRYQDLAMRTAYLVAPEADAADAVQDAFLKAYAALSRFRDGAPLRPWLLRIVANEARNRRRSATRRAILELRASGHAAPDQVAASPESDVLANEARETLHAAVGRLRDEEREVIGARYFLGLSEAETAEALSIPAGTVKSRTARAIGHLRETLADDRGRTRWLTSRSSCDPTPTWRPRCATCRVRSRGPRRIEPPTAHETSRPRSGRVSRPLRHAREAGRGVRPAARWSSRSPSCSPWRRSPRRRGSGCPGCGSSSGRRRRRSAHRRASSRAAPLLPGLLAHR